MTASSELTKRQSVRRLLATGVACTFALQLPATAQTADHLETGSAAAASTPAAAPAAVAPSQTPSSLDLNSADSLLNIPPGQPTAEPNDQQLINRIMQDTVTSPSTSAPPAQLGLPGELPMPELPPELKDHNKNKTINLGPLHTGP